MFQIWQHRVLGLRDTGDDIGSFVLPYVLHDGFKDVLSVHHVHHRAVLLGYVEQILNRIGFGMVFVALYIQYDQIGFGDVRNTASGLNQALALKLVGDQHSGASQRRR